MSNVNRCGNCSLITCIPFLCTYTSRRIEKQTPLESAFKGFTPSQVWIDETTQTEEDYEEVPSIGDQFDFLGNVYECTNVDWDKETETIVLSYVKVS